MAFMGVGSFVSRFFNKNLIITFLNAELLLSFLGGISVPILYLVFAYTEAFYLYKFIFTSLIALLVGLEIPFLLRLMKGYYPIKTNISNILSLDYLGALIATLLFPLLLFPLLGTFKTSLIFGLINIGLVFLNIFIFRFEMSKISKSLFSRFFIASMFVTTILITGIFSANLLIYSWGSEFYRDRIIYMKRSPYQKIVLTKYKNDTRMYLNGNLQFSSIDEYRYHESLVHIPMELLQEKSYILILGGGDGLAIRELLKYPQVKSIDLVELDKEVVKLAHKNHHLVKLNRNSLNSDKVRFHTQDAFTFLRYTKGNRKNFNLIIADLPDPSQISLAKLYTYEFYKLVQKRLHSGGVFVTQATSPFHARSSFWCIRHAISQSGFKTYPYHLNVPSFAEWGFIMASDKELPIHSIEIKQETRFLDNKVARSLFVFSKDIQGTCDDVNSLENPVVLTHYLKEWWYD